MNISKLIIVIKVSSVLFGLNLLLYIYNPYYLLRPLQIVEDNNAERTISNLYSFKTNVVPNEIYNLLAIPNSPESNYSVTRETRVKLFLQGRGNCSQQSTGMGLVLSNHGFNYSIVHFLPKVGLFKGAGHTVLNVIGDSISLLVDPILKIVPIVEDEMLDKRYMNIQDLSNRSNIYSTNSHKSVVNLSHRYWAPNFSSAYAEVSQSEMNKYFDSTKLLDGFLGLDDSKFKRTFVNGIMAFCWRLPQFKVKQGDYINLCHTYPNFVFLKYLGHFFIYNLYCLILLVFIFVVKFIKSKI
jgi:hypothetical protein